MELLRLKQQMQFIIEIDKLKSIFRQNYLADGSRRENDSEHSWHLAMMVTVLSEYFEGIDLAKTLKMVLIHDLVEIYAGDTFAYDEAAYADKDDREIKAAEKLFSLLPVHQSAEFMELWQEFERMDSQEAICAAIVDRVQPLTLNICSEGKMWQKRHVTVDKVLKRNQIVLERAPKILSDYVRNIIAEAENKGYFYKENLNKAFPMDISEHSEIYIRSAEERDIKLLAVMNRGLIQDEGSENPMNLEQLEERMKEFLQKEYKAAIIMSGINISGYCLFKIENQKDDVSFDIYVRQYYIKPESRRIGIGKHAFNLLMKSTFKGATNVKLDVLEINPIGKAFWKKVGFEPYSQCLRMKYI